MRTACGCGAPRVVDTEPGLCDVIEGCYDQRSHMIVDMLDATDEIGSGTTPDARTCRQESRLDAAGRRK
jgi:hypothetical protein